MTLERSYRRLLWAYPRWYRRERGVELLSTLLDAAAPDQRRPTVREAVDLVLGGLRCRFALPRGPGYRVVGALFVAIAACTDGLYVLAAALFAQRFAASMGRAAGAGRYASAATFIGLGAWTAVAGSHRPAS